MSKFLTAYNNDSNAGPLTMVVVDDTVTNGVWKATRTSKNDVTDSDDVTIEDFATEDAALQSVWNDRNKLNAVKARLEADLAKVNREITQQDAVIGVWTPPVEEP